MVVHFKCRCEASWKTKSVLEGMLWIIITDGSSFSSKFVVLRLGWVVNVSERIFAV